MYGTIRFVIEKFCYLLELFIFIDVILSWLPSNIRHSKAAGIVYAVTEPILSPIRKMLNNSPLGGGMMLDFSPFIALILINIIESILLTVLTSIF